MVQCPEQLVRNMDVHSAKLGSIVLERRFTQNQYHVQLENMAMKTMAMESQTSLALAATNAQQVGMDT